MTTSYVHGLDLVSQNRGGNVSWYHYDGQHSTRQLSDASAQVTDTYNYDAFGLLLQRTGSTENDYMYTGEQYDPNVGFYYLRARYYNPEIGRFTTVDPWKGSIYDPASLHKYVYCQNDPVDYVDWSGEITWALVGTIVVGAIIAAIITAHFNAVFFNKRTFSDYEWQDWVGLIFFTILGGLFAGLGGAITIIVFLRYYYALLGILLGLAITDVILN